MAATFNLDGKKAEIAGTLDVKVTGIDNASHIGAQLKSLIDALKSSGGKTSEFGDAVSGATDNLEALSDTAEQAADQQKRTVKSYAKVEKSIRTLQGNFVDLSTWAGDASKNLRKTSGAMSGLLETAYYNNQAQDKFLKKILQTSDTLKIFNKEGQKSFNSIYDLNNAQRDFAKDLLERQRALASDASDEALQEAFGKTRKQLQDDVKAREDEYNILVKATKQQTALLAVQSQIENKFGDLGKVLTGTAGAGTALALSFSLLKRSVSQYLEVGKSGVGNYLKNVAASSIALGISFQDATHLFAQNASVLSGMGGKEFAKVMEDGQKNLFKFTWDLKDAAEGAGEFAHAAVSAGLPLNQLGQSIADQASAFGKLQKITGVNVKQYASLNKALYTDQAVQMQLLAVNKNARRAKLQEIEDMRNSFATMTHDMDLAQRMTVAIQNFGKQKVTDRFEQAAKVQQAMGIMGLGQGGKAANIMRLGNRASKEDQVWLQTQLAELKKRMASGKMGESFGFENVIDQLEDQIGGGAKDMLEAGGPMKLASDTFADTADKLAQINNEMPKALQELTHTVSSFQSFLSGPIAGVIGTALLGVFGSAKMMKTFGSFLPGSRKGLFGGRSSSMIDKLSEHTRANYGDSSFSRPSAPSGITGKISDAISKGFGKVGELAKVGKGAATGLTETIGGLGGGMVGRAADAIGRMGGAAGGLLGKGVGLLGKALPWAAPIAMGAQFISGYNDADNVFGNEKGQSTMTEKLASGVGGVAKFFTMLIDSFLGTDLSGLVDDFTVKVGRFIEDAMDSIADWWDDLTLGKFIDQIGESISAYFKWLVGFWKRGLEAVKNGIMGVDKWIQNTITGKSNTPAQPTTGTPSADKPTDVSTAPVSEEDAKLAVRKKRDEDKLAKRASQDKVKANKLNTTATTDTAPTVAAAQVDNQQLGQAKTNVIQAEKQFTAYLQVEQMLAKYLQAEDMLSKYLQVDLGQIGALKIGEAELQKLTLTGGKFEQFSALLDNKPHPKLKALIDVSKALTPIADIQKTIAEESKLYAQKVENEKGNIDNSKKANDQLVEAAKKSQVELVSSSSFTTQSRLSEIASKVPSAPNASPVGEQKPAINTQTVEPEKKPEQNQAQPPAQAQQLPTKPGEKVMTLNDVVAMLEKTIQAIQATGVIEQQQLDLLAKLEGDKNSPTSNDRFNKDDLSASFIKQPQSAFARQV